MNIRYKKTFLKRTAKLSPKVQKQLEERLNLFTKDPFHPLLNNHELSGKYQLCRSINITGDYRAIYTQEPDGSFVFLIVGTHAELYG